MAELAVGLLGPAIDLAKWVAKPIARQFNYLCCFTSNINSLKDEAQKLNDATEGLEVQVQTAKNNGQDPVPAVQSWLDDSKKLKEQKINGILDEAKNVGTGCSKLGARFSLSKKAKKTTDRTIELRGQKPEAEFNPPPIAARLGVPLEKPFECNSRNEIEEDIMAALKHMIGICGMGGPGKTSCKFCNPDNSKAYGGKVKYMIGIYGMGGLGKTTMAKKIMNRVLEEHVFEEVVIATVSQNVDISKIQDEIGEKLGLETLKKKISQSARAQFLHSRLSDTKTTLLVLDDVWEKPALESIGIPFDSKWCTIIFTSRNRDSLRAMDVQHICRMEVLSEEEAWSFFRERVGSCVDDMNSIAKQVAKECGGMPINLAAVGAVLKGQTNAAIWKDTLRELKQSVPDTVADKVKENYNPLKWSYDYLKSKQEAQSLFLLCCLFPEDADIPLEYLTNFCWGLGIFKGVGITNMEDARNKMFALIEFLKDRSLLLDSDKEDCVRMHDVVRDVATFIAKEEGYIGKDGCTWISSSHLGGERNVLLSRSKCPNLRLLFLDSGYDDESFEFKIYGAFMEGMRELHVLCIQRYSLLTKLQHPTQSLGKLNTLILESCEKLKTISVVGELVNLEILICRRCGSIEELPSEMKRLNRLKVLDLTRCINLQRIGRGIISSLVGLEELKMHRSFNRWEAEDREERENAGLRELEALTNLACLEIDIMDRSLVTENMPLLSKKIVRYIIRTDLAYYFHSIPSKFSKAMRLCLERETRLGDWIEMQLLKDTEYLNLRGDGANNVELTKIQNIRWLGLLKCESMKNVVRTSGGDDATVFPYIEYLKLESLPELQEICDGPISSTSFQNLKELEFVDLKALTQFWKSSSVCENNYVPHFTNLSYIYIWKCDGLRNLGQLSMAGKDCLPQLQKLRIERCEMMEQVFLWDDERHVITKVFPKLEGVWLVSLPSLTTFYQGIQGIEFPLLRKMEITECPKMKSIIGSSSADNDDGYLHLLCQTQKISFGSSFKVLEINNNPFCGHEIPSSLFNGLEELRINKYEGSMSLFMLSMAANLVSLTKLHIANCDGLRNLGQLSMDCLPQLEQLRITKCAMMEQVFLWNNEEAGENKTGIESQRKRHVITKVFLKLKEVRLEDLPNLTTFYQGIQGIEFPLLGKMEIQNCPKMKSIIGSSSADIDEDGYLHLICQPQKVSFGSLKVLEINHNPFCGHEIPSSLFNGLEKLRINKYEGSMSLFTLSMAANLVSLRELHVMYCYEMMKVIEDEQQVASAGEKILLFPKLEELCLAFLPNLVSFCEWKCDVELPSLTKVEIRWCPNMENFSMGFVTAPNLKIVEIDDEEIGGTKDLNGALQQHYLACREKDDKKNGGGKILEKNEIEEDDQN